MTQTKKQIQQLRSDIENYIEKYKDKKLHLIDLSELFRIISKSGIRLEENDR